MEDIKKLLDDMEIGYVHWENYRLTVPTTHHVLTNDFFLFVLSLGFKIQVYKTQLTISYV